MIVDTYHYLTMVEELLKQDKQVSLPIKGNSMAPFLINNRDCIYLERPKRVLKKGDFVLYQRINKRVDIMLENGLLDEVKELLKMGYTKDMISMQGIGYKEMIKYLDGEYTYDEAIEIIKRDSRRYAKRQLTWFKRYQDAKWFDLDKYQDIEILKEDIINHIEKLLEIV